MIAYRLALPEDLSAIEDLLCRTDKTFPIPLSDKTDLGALAQKLIRNGYVYMALDGAEPVGLIGFYANDTQTYTAYISVVGVIDSHQRRGIAGQMVRDVLDICKAKGMAVCTLYTHKTNLGAIAMYEKLGFRASSDSARPHDIKFTKEL